MTTPIYLPATPSIGESIGSALGTYAAVAMAKKEREDRMKEFQEYDNAIRNAGSREKAFEIAGHIPYQSLDEQQQVTGYINQVWPARDETPQQITITDEHRNKITKFVKPKDIPAEGIVTEQALSHWFDAVDKEKGIYTDKGEAPTNKPPTPTSITKEQLDLEEKARDNARQAAAREKVDIDQTLQMNKMYNNVLLQALNVKKYTGLDGSLILDFEGNDKKEDAYRKALVGYSEYMKKYNNDYNKAAVAALEDSGALERPTPEEPTDQPPTKRGITDMLRDAFAHSKTPAVTGKTAAPEAKPTAFIKGKVYVDAKGNKATYKGKDKNGKDIWE